MPNKNRPVHELRLGRVKASIWANQTERGLMHNVTFQRLYHDGQTWKTTESFGRDDLPLIAKVADRAHSWIYEHAKEGASKEAAA